MTSGISHLRALGLTTALTALAACSTSELDWDQRSSNYTLNTSEAVLGTTAPRPQADARGVISYPDYQVAVARPGDTVAGVAARVGVDAGELARANALQPGAALRPGEVLALPRRVAASGGNTATVTGAVIGGSIQSGPIDVTTLASGAIDRAAEGGTPGSAAAPANSNEPVGHKVARGETAFSIARTYNVSPRALADWNGLGPDMSLREGQFLMIPSAAASQTPRATAVTLPGVGTPTPTPPSAKKPLPDQAIAAATAKPAGTPVSPDLGNSRTAASAARYTMPVDGKIIRGYAKGKNEGIDIAAAAGTPVRAATDGTVAVITKDTNQVLTLVIRNADDLLTVYTGIDGATVTKGTKIKRGQTIAKVRAANPAFLHFEVRKGMESQDPMSFLQ